MIQAQRIRQRIRQRACLANYGMPSRRNAAVKFVLVLGLACSSACTTHHDPQAAYDHARQTYRRGDLAGAEEEAERGYKEFHSRSREWAWQFTILRAKVLYSRGMDDEALRLMASEPDAPLSGDLAVQKRRLEAVAYASSARLTEAEGSLAVAESMCAVSAYPSCADLVSTRGFLEMEGGHYIRAQSSYERASSSARAAGDQFLEATALLNLSWSADEQTHFDEALDWSNAARKISLAQGYDDISQTALGNMGWAYYKLGDPEKAEVMFAEAKEQAEKLHNLTDQVTWLQAIGYIHLDAHKFGAAEESYRQALKLAQHTNRDDLISSLIALAFVSEQTNKLDDAKRYADEALAKAREDNNGRDAVYPQLVQGRVAARLHDTATAENAFREVAQAKDTPVFLKWEAERSLARLYDDEKRLDSANREYRVALDTFETARSELQHEDSRLPFLTNASRIYDDYIHFLIGRGKIDEALQVADFSRGRTLREGLGLLQKGTSFKLDPLNAKEIAGRAGGTVLFYWLGEEQSYLWAITPQKIKLFPLPSAAGVKERVERYRKAIIEQRESLQIASDDGAALYRILVEPAKDLLPRSLAPKDEAQKSLAKTGRVFIVPDGSLNSLNFETLIVSAPQPEPHSETQPEPQAHYWIEDVTLSSASSLRMLQAFHAAHSKGTGDLLLFGDAIAPNEDFPRLPEAAIEMENIGKHFSSGQEQVFSREQANPAAYLASDPERFSYIHFVAHGTASSLSPLDSAIVLSRADAPKADSSKAGVEEDSFKLYARDIIHHPLRAELVTVSTCRSAGERAYSGEGLVGLSWAFVRAGAHNVIGALWDVSDASTPRLMDELYGELKKGETPDAALRHAKLTLLRSGAAFRKPFYWAPFQLYAGS
jgi:CHAT domain-containing protein/Flp pilus assembly protein TadD